VDGVNVDTSEKRINFIQSLCLKYTLSCISATVAETSEF
jgi:hypothetical protein